MNKIIKLDSRGCENNYLKQLKKPDGSETKSYLLVVSAPFVGVGYTSEGLLYIDPSGGPMIVTGEILEEAEAVVKSIDFVTKHGYVITFE